LGAVLLALLFTTGILLIAGAPPLEAYRQIVVGSLGSVKKITDVLVAWVPLVLATSGLLVTFAAGLWNIGIEGQITLGAIFTTGALRALQASSLPPAASIAVQDFRRSIRDHFIGVHIRRRPGPRLKNIEWKMFIPLSGNHFSRGLLNHTSRLSR